MPPPNWSQGFWKITLIHIEYNKEMQPSEQLVTMEMRCTSHPSKKKLRAAYCEIRPFYSHNNLPSRTRQVTPVSQPRAPDRVVVWTRSASHLSGNLNLNFPHSLAQYFEDGAWHNNCFEWKHKVHLSKEKWSGLDAVREAFRLEGTFVGETEVASARERKPC